MMVGHSDTQNFFLDTNHERILYYQWNEEPEKMNDDNDDTATVWKAKHLKMND